QRELRNQKELQSQVLHTQVHAFAVIWKDPVTENSFRQPGDRLLRVLPRHCHQDQEPPPDAGNNIALDSDPGLGDALQQTDHFTPLVRAPGCPALKFISPSSSNTRRKQSPVRGTLAEPGVASRRPLPPGMRSAERVWPGRARRLKPFARSQGRRDPGRKTGVISLSTDSPAPPWQP